MTQKQKAPPRRTAGPEDEADKNAHRIAPLRVVQPPNDDDIAIDFGAPKRLLPENQWFDAKFTDWSTAFVFNTGKVFLHFRIVSPGEFFDVEAFKPFRAKKVITKGKRGKFVLAAAGDLYSTMVDLMDLRLRADRVSLQPLRSMVFNINFRTVSTNYKKATLPAHLQYSVIHEIRRG